MHGTEAERQVIERALGRTRLDWDEALWPGLWTDEYGAIDVWWLDLSMFDAQAEAGEYLHVELDVDHPHCGYAFIDRGGVTGRRRVLGVAWTNARIDLDGLLSANDEVAALVFVSQLAHALDYFCFTVADRVTVYSALHPELTPEFLQSDRLRYGWWVEGADQTHRSAVCEALMDGVVKAVSDISVVGRCMFTHEAPPAAVKVIRQVLGVDRPTAGQ